MKKITNYLFKTDRFDPQLTTYKTRKLNVCEPSTHFFMASDGVELRLKRYNGNTKNSNRGSVILSHCIGVSSLMYAIDTIDVNLLEYLFNEGYDVWLLDHRLSIELPASGQLSTMDDVATKDYPATVKTVCEIAGVENVQIVAHGVGASTLTMALLSGLENVSGAVCSQVSTHLYSLELNNRKAKLRAPAILRALGKKCMTAYTDSNAGLLTKAYDASLIFMPLPKHEQCNSPACHRISTLFGELYEHAQLNADTHMALPRMFGRVNLSAMKQLTEILLKNHLIDANGNNSYLPNIERLKLPMLFLSGSNNVCVLPESTQKIIETLADANGAQYYKRQEIGNYGHVDCIIGENAARDVYPFILDLLTSSQKTSQNTNQTSHISQEKPKIKVSSKKVPLSA